MHVVVLTLAWALFAYAEISQDSDWLLHRPTTAASVTPTDEGISISNGIVERGFLIRGDAFCTISYQHLQTSQTFFRGVSPEGHQMIG